MRLSVIMVMTDKNNADGIYDESRNGPLWQLRSLAPKANIVNSTRIPLRDRLNMFGENF